MQKLMVKLLLICFSFAPISANCSVPFSFSLATDLVRSGSVPDSSRGIYQLGPFDVIEGPWSDLKIDQYGLTVRSEGYGVTIYQRDGGLFSINQFTVAGVKDSTQNGFSVLGYLSGNYSYKSDYSFSPDVTDYVAMSDYAVPHHITYQLTNLQAITFSTGMGAFVLKDLSGASAVPEVSAWIMMICGFGLVGTVIRHRRTKLFNYVGALGSD